MKKVICFILCLCLSASLFPVAMAENTRVDPADVDTHEMINMGDLDHDFAVTAKDALLLLKVIVGKDVPEVVYGTYFDFIADANGDAGVNAADALYLLQCSVKKRALSYSYLDKDMFSEKHYYTAPSLKNPVTEFSSLDEVPIGIREEYASYDFENDSLYMIIICDNYYQSDYVPQVYQVVENKENLLISFRYTKEKDEEPVRAIMLMVKGKRKTSAISLKLNNTYAPEDLLVSSAGYYDPSFGLDDESFTFVAKSKEELYQVLARRPIAYENVEFTCRQWLRWHNDDFYTGHITVGICTEGGRLFDGNRILESIWLEKQGTTAIVHVSLIYYGLMASISGYVGYSTVDIPISDVKGCTDYKFDVQTKRIDLYPLENQ